MQRVGLTLNGYKPVGVYGVNSKGTNDQNRHNRKVYADVNGRVGKI